jgi:tetratricopeptide (TPR) repeat protein
LILKNQKNDSLNVLVQAYDLVKKLNNEKFYADVYFILGYIHYTYEHYIPSLDYFERALKIKLMYGEMFYAGLINLEIAKVKLRMVNKGIFEKNKDILKTFLDLETRIKKAIKIFYTINNNTLHKKAIGIYNFIRLSIDSAMIG